MFETRDEGVISKHIILCVCFFFLSPSNIVFFLCCYSLGLFVPTCSVSSSLSLLFGLRAFCKRLNLRYLSLCQFIFLLRQYIGDLICVQNNKMLQFIRRIIRVDVLCVHIFILSLVFSFGKWTRVRQDNNKSFIKCISHYTHSRVTEEKKTKSSNFTRRCWTYTLTLNRNNQLEREIQMTWIRNYRVFFPCFWCDVCSILRILLPVTCPCVCMLFQNDKCSIKLCAHFRSINLPAG